MNRDLDRQQPKSVVNLIIGFNATEEVSLNGSPPYPPLPQRGTGSFFRIYLYQFLGVIPCASGIRHKYRLIKPKDRDRDQVADKEVRVNAGKREGCEKDRQK